MGKYNLPRAPKNIEKRFQLAYEYDLKRIGITQADINERGVPDLEKVSPPKGRWSEGYVGEYGISYFEEALREYYDKPLIQREDPVQAEPEITQEKINQEPVVAPSPEEVPITVSQLEPEPEQIPETPQEVVSQEEVQPTSEATSQPEEIPQVQPEPVAPSPEETPTTVSETKVEPEQVQPSQPQEVKVEQKVQPSEIPNVKLVEDQPLSAGAPPIPPKPPNKPPESAADKEPPHNLLDLSIAHEKWLRKIYNEIWSANRNIERINDRLRNRLLRFGPGSGLAGGGGGRDGGKKRAGDFIDENGNLVDTEGNIVEEKNIKYDSPILQAIHDVSEFTKDPSKFLREKITETVGGTRTFAQFNEIKETFFDPFSRKGRILGDQNFPGLDPRRWSNLDAVMNLDIFGPRKAGFAPVPRMGNIYQNISQRIPGNIKQNISSRISGLSGKIPKFAEGGILKPVLSQNNVSINSLSQISDTLQNTSAANPFKLQLNQLNKPLGQSLTLPSKVGGGLVLGVLDNILTPLGPLLGPLGPMLPELFGKVSSGFGLNPGLVNSNVAAIKAQMQIAQTQQPTSTSTEVPAPSTPSTIKNSPTPSISPTPSSTPETTSQPQQAQSQTQQQPQTSPNITPPSIPKPPEPSKGQNMPGSDSSMNMPSPPKTPDIKPSEQSTSSRVANTLDYNDTEPMIVPVMMPQHNESMNTPTPPNKTFVSSNIAFFVLQPFY